MLVLVPLHFEHSIDRAWEEDVSSLWCSILSCLFQHLSDDLAEVEHWIQFTLGCLELVYVCKLDCSLLNSVFNNSFDWYLKVSGLYELTEASDVVPDLIILLQLLTMYL